jgi:hypothetical protein
MDYPEQVLSSSSTEKEEPTRCLNHGAGPPPIYPDQTNRRLRGDISWSSRNPCRHFTEGILCTPTGIRNPRQSRRSPIVFVFPLPQFASVDFAPLLTALPGVEDYLRYDIDENRSNYQCHNPEPVGHPGTLASIPGAARSRHRALNQAVTSATYIFRITQLVHKRFSRQFAATSYREPYATLAAATITPAQFLGEEEEFGAVSEGLRADLLLLTGNPLTNISALSDPAGIMVNGDWYSGDALETLSLRAGKF